MTPKSLLLKKINSRSALVGIVGVGYVGSALGLGASAGGFTVIGFGRSRDKIDRINKLGNRRFTATDDTSKLAKCAIVCVCVPTPVHKNKSPDLSFLKQALTTIHYSLRVGQLVIIESSIAPGTTRRIALPILETSRLRLGRDFFLGFSPERIDPGNITYTIVNTPKIVSGIDKDSESLVYAFYQQFVDAVIRVSSPETAELTKVFENVFRFVNISLVNEISSYARRIGVNMWEVINAASTKPYGFLPHYPGPGIGGDCIPVLPRHLLASARKARVPLKIVEAAIKVDDLQPKKVARRALSVLNGSRTKNSGRPHVLLVGISYKPDSSDIRQSATVKIWKLLERAGVSVTYHDPHVPEYNGASSIPLQPQCLAGQDLIIIATAHSNIPYDLLVGAGKPLLDTRNILAQHRQSHIIRL